MRFSDEELMVMYASGAREAFDILYERYRHRIYGFALTCLRNSADAEEIVQDVFLRVSSAAPRYRPEGRFKSWLFRIAANRIRTEIITRKRWGRAGEERTDERIDSSRSDPEEALVARDLVEKFFATIPETQRMVLVLKEVEGMSSPAVACALGLTDENVRVLLHRSRKRFSDFLHRRKGEVEK